MRKKKFQRLSPEQYEINLLVRAIIRDYFRLKKKVYGAKTKKQIESAFRAIEGFCISHGVNDVYWRLCILRNHLYNLKN